jgi:hypothetical protein
MKIPCAAGESCWQLRDRGLEETITIKQVPEVEVPDDHTGPAYCCFSCAILMGAMKIHE